ncbi:MAG: eukaryotic-like serine/threonine-protein kinase, partial [Pseudonocardiales bacterium]|nr:eukaryotic-like serine/threonine-protein kinase [Pseudonocardiales bacterium]
MNKLGDRYVLLDQLGAGAMGVVWRARDELLHRDVAVKQMLLNDVQPAEAHEAVQRAMREGRIAARLQHPNAIAVYDVVLDNGKPCLVMEFLPSKNLSAILDERGPMPPKEAARIGSLAASALAAAHTAGIVHRDIKPANVLMGRDGRVRLTDFGIARLVDAARVTSTGMMVGTASYLAPEQVAGEPVGPAADVYALGLVLLECLTGQREYAGSTVEVALARLHRPPQVPAALPSGWPALLQAMTAREPGARPTPEQAAAALDVIARGGQATTVVAAPAPERTTVLPPTRVAQAPVETAAPPPARAAVPPRRRSSAPLVVVLLVLVAAIAGGAYLLNTRETVLTPLP